MRSPFLACVSLVFGLGLATLLVMDGVRLVELMGRPNSFSEALARDATKDFNEREAVTVPGPDIPGPDTPQHPPRAILGGRPSACRPPMRPPLSPSAQRLASASPLTA